MLLVLAVLNFFILWLFGDIVFELSLNHITHVMLMC